MDPHTRSARGRVTHTAQKRPCEHRPRAKLCRDEGSAVMVRSDGARRFTNAAGQGRAVEGVNGRLRRAVVRHFDEAKAPRTTGFTVGHDPDRVDAAIRLEELAEVLLRGSNQWC